MSKAAPMSSRSPFLRVVALATLALVSVSCGNPEQDEPPLSGRASLGELVYRILRDTLANSDDCPQQYVAELTEHHTDFVETFDHTISVNITNDLPDVLGGTITPLVENGKLPNLVDQLAISIALLVDDEFDPDRAILGSLVHLSEARTMLEASMVFEVVEAILADPMIRDKVHALALLAQEHDGVDYLIDEALGLLTNALEYESPTSCSGLEIPDLQTTVFRTQGFVEDASLALGQPAYGVRWDAHHNPVVKIDTVTGTLSAPFVDLAPADGVADVDASGAPIDASGAVIEIPILGSTGARDSYGRALNANGGLLYEYYDVKRTTASYALQLVADFLAAGHLHDVAPIVDAALGEPTVCDYGTPLETCREYGTADNPVADLAYTGIDLLRYPKLVQFMDALQMLLTSDPAKAESLLITAGDVVTALDASTLTLTDTVFLDSVRDLLPIVDQLFQVPNTVNGTTTPRLLADIIHDLSESQRAAVPTHLGYLMEYGTITNQPMNGQAPEGTMVDFAQTRFYSSGGSTIDNRALMEKLVDMIGYADCGSIRPAAQGGGQTSDLMYAALDSFYRSNEPNPSTATKLQPGTLAEVIVDVAGRLTTEQLKSLLALTSWITGGNDTAALQTAMVNIGCTTQAPALAYHLNILKSISNTGVLDWALPIVKLFGQQGQRRVAVDMGLRLAADLALDGGYANVGTPGTPVLQTRSGLRRLLPPLVSLVHTGALARLIDALNTLYTIQSGNDTAVDLLFDIAAYAVRIPQAGIPTRTGVKTNTSRMNEMFGALMVLGDRVNAADADDELSSLVHFVTGYLQRTDALAGGGRRLHFRNLRLLLSIGSELLHDAAQLSNQDFLCYVDGLQDEGVGFLEGRHFATLVRMARQLLVSENSAVLEDWIVSLLRGMPSAPEQETYGRLLQIGAAVAAADPDQVSDADLENLTHWLSGVTSMTSGANLRDMLATLDEILVADTNGVVFQIVRNAVAAGPLESGEVAAVTMANIYADVDAIDASNMCVAGDGPLTVPNLEATIEGILEFIDDDQNGLGAIWRLVGTVAPAE